MIIDDEKDWARWLADSLEERGFSADTSFDTFSGQSKALNGKPDLILLDIKMPGGGGMELLERLRINNNTALIPIIVISANINNEAEKIMKKYGVSDYFAKPIEVADLLARIDKIFSEKET